MNRTQVKAKLLETTSMGLALSTSLLLSTLVYPSVVEAQQQNAASDQESLLPPEVVPVDPLSAASTSSIPGASNSLNGMAAPGLVSNPNEGNAAPANEMQSAQDFRKSLMDSLSGKGNYPQFNGQNPYANNPGQSNNQYGQGGQPPSQMNNNQSFANAGQPPLGQSDLMAPSQDNTMVNAAPPQTQVLSGGTPAPQVSQRGGYGLAHGLGIGSSLGMSAFSYGAMGGGAGLYGLGMTGASLLNYGLRSGFKF